MTPSSRRACCFTKSYHQYLKGTGSLLARSPQHVAWLKRCASPSCWEACCGTAWCSASVRGGRACFRLALFLLDGVVLVQGGDGGGGAWGGGGEGALIIHRRGALIIHAAVPLLHSARGGEHPRQSRALQLPGGGHAQAAVRAQAKFTCCSIRGFRDPTYHKRTLPMSRLRGF